MAHHRCAGLQTLHGASSPCSPRPQESLVSFEPVFDGSRHFRARPSLSIPSLYTARVTQDSLPARARTPPPPPATRQPLASARYMHLHPLVAREPPHTAHVAHVVQDSPRPPPLPVHRPLPVHPFPAAHAPVAEELPPPAARRTSSAHYPRHAKPTAHRTLHTRRARVAQDPPPAALCLHPASRHPMFGKSYPLPPATTRRPSPFSHAACRPPTLRRACALAHAALKSYIM
ncbi:hypothetical protein GGX14DRAFT_561524 [Mycena pura]|uniref:Uncharacterized protein n=1 Tax=Mycena pura TaxID=153505 RepID=A0AAD6VQI3_9AGAR|nr:hypothetical protein GGX14DRAFT_561524 [Mycena pura]